MMPLGIASTCESLSGTFQGMHMSCSPDRMGKMHMVGLQTRCLMIARQATASNNSHASRHSGSLSAHRAPCRRASYNGRFSSPVRQASGPVLCVTRRRRRQKKPILLPAATSSHRRTSSLQQGSRKLRSRPSSPVPLSQLRALAPESKAPPYRPTRSSCP